MKNTKKWAWLTLGIGVMALGVLSSFWTSPPEGQQTAKPAQAQKDEAAPEESSDNEAAVPGRQAEVTPPGGRRMPPIEFRRDDANDHAGEIRDRWRLKSGAGNIPPDIRDTPPLQLEEPKGLGRGRREAFNEAEPEALQGGGDAPPQNYWEPPPPPPEPEQNGAVPADGGFGFDPPPPPDSDSGDYQPEPSGDSDPGGGD